MIWSKQDNGDESAQVGPFLIEAHYTYWQVSWIVMGPMPMLVRGRPADHGVGLSKEAAEKWVADLLLVVEADYDKIDPA